MPVTQSVAVDGIKELGRAMRKAGKDVANTMRDANRSLADEVATAARGRAPRLTGRLANSVRGRATATSASVVAGGARVPYAQPIHWGWPRRNIKAQPFLTDAAENVEDDIVDRYFKRVDNVLDQIRSR